MVEWDGSLTAENELLFSTDLIHWELYPGNVQKSDAGRHSAQIEPTEQQAFFRLRFTLPTR